MLGLLNIVWNIFDCGDVIFGCYVYVILYGKVVSLIICGVRMFELNTMIK